MPTVIFIPSESADEDYSIEFTEMYVEGAIVHELTVDQLTGWVKVVDQ